MTHKPLPTREYASFSEVNEKVSKHMQAMIRAHGHKDVLSKQVCKELGVSKRVLSSYLFGGVLPPPEFNYRFLRWHGQGETFESAPTKRTRRKTPTNNYTRVQGHVRNEDYEALVVLAKRLNMTIFAVVNLAIVRFVRDNPPYVTIRDIAEDVGAAMVGELLAQDNGLKEILQADPEIATHVQKQPKKSHKQDDFVSAEELLHVEITDGPASSVWIPAEDWEEL